MLASNTILIGLSLLMGIGGYLVFLWAVKSGQFEECEEIKHQIFNEPEE